MTAVRSAAKKYGYVEKSLTATPGLQENWPVSELFLWCQKHKLLARRKLNHLSIVSLVHRHTKNCNFVGATLVIALSKGRHKACPYKRP